MKQKIWGFFFTCTVFQVSQPTNYLADSKVLKATFEQNLKKYKTDKKKIMEIGQELTKLWKF